MPKLVPLIQASMQVHLKEKPISGRRQCKHLSVSLSRTF